MTTSTAYRLDRARESRVQEGVDLYRILECPNCKTGYRINPSLFAGWKSARLRCRKCRESFTVSVPVSESSEPPAGILGVPVTTQPAPEIAAQKESPTATPPEMDLLPHPQPQCTPEEPAGTALPHPLGQSSDQDLRSWRWSLLASLAIVSACGLAMAGLMRVLASRFFPM